MANRIVGNVYILDSSEGATVNLGWNAGSTIQSIGFWGANTSGEMILTSGQSNQIVHFSFLQTVAVNSGITMVPAFQVIHLGGVQFKDNLQLQTLTAGTGWIYFS